MSSRFVSAIMLGLMFATALPVCAAQVTIPIKASMNRPNGSGGWEPNRITVHQGDVVTLKITSADMGHQLEIAGLGVKSPIVNGGQTASVTFTASKAGSFPFTCTSVCGPLHAQMKGTLVVQP
jgi:heme/copper-type cytochrome/quinol oxidase subunit 2